MTEQNFTATMSPYGYPIASFTPSPMVVSRRIVVVHAIIWDAPYGFFRASGYYAKKDGTAGAQIAKPLMAPFEVPVDIRAALEALIP